MELIRNSQATPAHGKNKKRNRIVTLAVLLVIVALVAAAVVKNRGLHIVAGPDQLGVTLEPEQQPTPSLSTHNDASPIVTAPNAHVEARVTGVTKPTPSQEPPASGMSTYGAASPIVTGQGAVVTSTVDTRP